MTNMRCVIGAAMAAVLCSPSVGAEDLLQVYRQSLESDPVLKAAAANQQASQEAKPQARALLLPNIGVTASQGKTFGAVNTQEGETHSYAISLIQPLYNRSSQVQQRLAEATVNQADVDFLNAQNDLILRVAQAYFSVLAAIDNLTFATAEKNAFARQLEQANRRFEVGLATITDVYDAQARFDGAVSSEISAANTLANTREQLQQLTGQNYAHVNVLGKQMPLTLPKPSDPDAWVRMALENNLSLQSAGFGVEQARENIKLQKSGHYPTLDLSVSRADVDGGFTHTYSSQANLQLTIPLYSGGAVSSRSRQAAYNYEASRQSLEDLQRNIITTVRNAYRGQETAISQIKALDQTRVSTRSALEATQAGYEVGTRTIVDVLNAETDVYRAERDYAASRYSYVVNVLTLRQAAGRLTEEDVVEINGWLGAPHPTSGLAAAQPSGGITQPAAAQSQTGGKNAMGNPVAK